jgi:hypothetical protein
VRGRSRADGGAARQEWVRAVHALDRPVFVRLSDDGFHGTGFGPRGCCVERCGATRGDLAQAPWLPLPFFALATTLITYTRSKRGLGGAWLVIEIAFLDTFYVSIFHPRGFGGSVAPTSGLRELASWPAAARSALLAEIESYRRLVVLMTELNQQFVEIAAAAL